MVAKRVYPYSATSGNVTAKRLKYLEGAVKRNRSEMFHKTSVLKTSVSAIATGVPGIVTSNLLDIQGGSGVSTRSGLKIRIWRVELRGFSNPALDIHLVQSHGTVAPAVGTFASRFLATDSTNTLFTEWKYYKNMNSSDDGHDYSPARFVHKFPKGMIVKYNSDSSGVPVDNGLYLAVTNFAAAAGDVDVSVRVWYTDE